jgi:hypothetical protein
MYGLVLGGLAVAGAVADEAARGLRFDSPQVLDMAVVPVTSAGESVPLSTLPASEADAMFDGDNPSPVRLRYFEDGGDCAAAMDCVADAERRRVAAEAGRVVREGARLRVVAAQGEPVEFVDWSQPATPDADGDEEIHRYLGRLDGSGYHRIEVQFGHDAPGSFLVNPTTGRTAFVHEGGDVVVLAPDGLALVTFNALNPPLSLRIAALDAAGPRRVLSCAARAVEARAEPVLVGWRDARSFDLTVDFAEGEREFVRFSREGAGWSVAASDPPRLAEIGFECQQAD